jgi:hypothetical protein
VVIPKIEDAAAVEAAAAVALEDGPPDLAGDGLALVARALLPGFLDVQQGTGAVQVLGGVPLHCPEHPGLYCDQVVPRRHARPASLAR